MSLPYIRWMGLGGCGVVGDSWWDGGDWGGAGRHVTAYLANEGRGWQGWGAQVANRRARNASPPVRTTGGRRGRGVGESGKGGLSVRRGGWWPLILSFLWVFPRPNVCMDHSKRTDRVGSSRKPLPGRPGACRGAGEEVGRVSSFGSGCWQFTLSK
jgi:hypothetical protein